jgi:hypothetical protein
MLARVRNTPLEALDGEPLTLSAGVAAVRADDVDVGAALARADAALYRAKNGGRDRVEGEDPSADVLAPADPSDARWVPTDEVASPAWAELELERDGGRGLAGGRCRDTEWDP